MRKIPFLFIFLLISACAVTPVRELSSHRQEPFRPILQEDADLMVRNPGNRKTGPGRYRFVGVFNNAEYTPLIDLVNAARRTIDIEIYMMTDKTFRAALRRALARGVKIRIVKDPTPLGETCRYFLPEELEVETSAKDPDCRDQRELVKEIRSNGGAVVPFNKPEVCGQDPAVKQSRCYQHGKMVIIDREIKGRRLALLSSGNFNSSSLCLAQSNPSTCNRDYSYVTRDQEVIEKLLSVFENDLEGKRYFPAAGPAAGKVTVSPFSKAPLIEFIRKAKRRIQVQNQYMKDEEVNLALVEAARRGIQVEMMLASDCAFARPNESAKARLEALYRPLEDAGIKLRFFTAQMRQQGRRGYLHSKAVVIDEEAAWVGSVNGSTTSLDVNREFGIFFNHPERVRFLSELITADFQHENSQSWQEGFFCKKDYLSR